MVKRILLASLFLFMPLFANAEVVVLGHDLDERNIPLDLNVMDRAFNLAFHDDALRENFYRYFYKSIEVPFSMRDLYKTCYVSTVRLGHTGNGSQCADFTRYYIEGIRKQPIDYEGKQIDISNEAKQEAWNKIKSFSVNN